MSGYAAYQSVQRGSRDELVTRHAAMVKKIAYHVAGRLPANVEVDDLVQAGMMGLLEAASHFEEGKGASFETFASIRIRGAMLDQVRREGWAPRVLGKRLREVSQAISRVEQRTRREASSAEVSQELGMSMDEYSALMRDGSSLYMASLDQLTEEGFDAAAEDEKQDNPLAALLQQGFTDSLAEHIRQLPEREQLVLALYYDKGLNLKEIGEVLSVSESRVSQIHSQAVVRLRGYLEDWAEEVA